MLAALRLLRRRIAGILLLSGYVEAVFGLPRKSDLHPKLLGKFNDIYGVHHRLVCSVKQPSVNGRFVLHPAAGAEHVKRLVLAAGHVFLLSNPQFDVVGQPLLLFPGEVLFASVLSSEPEPEAVPIAHLQVFRSCFVYFSSVAGAGYNVF